MGTYHKITEKKRGIVSCSVLLGPYDQKSMNAYKRWKDRGKAEELILKRATENLPVVMILKYRFLENFKPLKSRSRMNKKEPRTVENRRD